MNAASSSSGLAGAVDSIAETGRQSVERAGALASDGYQAAAQGLNDAGQSAASVFATDYVPDPANSGSGSSSSLFGLFGSLNTVFARIAFVFLLLVGFYFLGSLGVAFLGWYTRPDRSPMLIPGMLNGVSAVDITQDPAKTSAILVSRSNNESTGAEFSWSVWLNLNPQLPTDANKNPFSCIFTKGSGAFDPDTGVNSSNGPGLYVRTDPTGACELGVAMDTTTRNVPDWIRVPNMPLEKWVHVLIRLENMQLQVYVNSSVVASHTLSAVPRQNFYDLHVCPNKGFAGSLSNLRYYDHAISVIRMRALLASGPNTAPSTVAVDASKASGTYTYLSDAWYA